MRLSELIHAPSRVSWTVRLLLYVAVVATVGLFVQFFHFFFP